MRSEQETARIVRAWLEPGVTVLPERVIDGVLGELAATPQHRPRPTPVRAARIVVAAAVLVAAVVGGLSVVQRIGTAISDRAPDAPPALAPRSLASMPAGPIDAGPYLIDAGFPVQIALDVPQGWSKTSLGADYAVLTKHPDGVPERPPSGVSLGFYTVANLFAEPCDSGRGMADPPVGPTVDDLVTAFTNLPDYRTSAPTSASIDGYRGRRIELDIQLFMCPFDQVQVWKTPTGSVRRLASEEELSTLWILDVAGERLVVDATSYPGTTQADLDELQSVVESIEFTQTAP